MFGRKKLSELDIKSIVLMLDDFNRIYPDASKRQKEYFLAKTLEAFGVKTKVGYTKSCIPPPPFKSDCNVQTNPVSTKLPIK